MTCYSLTLSLSHTLTYVQKNLTQENYSLKMKVERLGSSVSNLQQELDGTLAQLDQVNATHAKRLAEVHSKTISDLAAINEDLKVDIGKLNVSCWRCCVVYLLVGRDGRVSIV